MGFIYSHYGSKVQHKKWDIKIILPIYYSWETTHITEVTSYNQNGGILQFTFHLNRIKICVANRIQQAGSHN